MPKMSEFIGELQEKLGLYGDHDVVMADESDPSVEFEEEGDEGPAFVLE